VWLFLLSCFPQAIFAEKKAITHIVQKGDTLWSICDKYYHDPFLWPELWEMNKFITNPHWLKPGDVITLLKYGKEREPIPIKQEVAIPVEKSVEAPHEPVKPTQIHAIDASSLTNVEALGFLRRHPIDPWGRIFDLKAEKVLIGEKNIVYVTMHKEDIRPGDAFIVYSISNPIEHPLNKEECGYIHSFKGVMTIEELKEQYCVGRIQKSFRSIKKDDLLMPYHPVSPCVFPRQYDGDLHANVIAAKENLQLHGQYSVVYIDRGFEDGITKGNILDVIEERESHLAKEQTVNLPPSILANVLVLATTKNTSAGVVFWSSKDFGNGVKIRPALWQAAFKRLSSLPSCP
jgi:hypothetical protein